MMRTGLQVMILPTKTQNPTTLEFYVTTRHRPEYPKPLKVRSIDSTKLLYTFKGTLH